jgi:hypothetical protein
MWGWQGYYSGSRTSPEKLAVLTTCIRHDWGKGDDGFVPNTAPTTYAILESDGNLTDQPAATTLRQSEHPMVSATPNIL